MNQRPQELQLAPLPPDEQALELAPLALAELGAGEQAAHLGRVVVRDCCLEVLPERARLTQLAAEPAQEAHGGGVRRHRRPSMNLRMEP